MAYGLLLFVPLSLVLRYLVDAPAGWVFLTSAAAITVLAECRGDGERTGQPERGGNSARRTASYLQYCAGSASKAGRPVGLSLTRSHRRGYSHADPSAAQGPKVR
jgi:hypothetical protein